MEKTLRCRELRRFWHHESDESCESLMIKTESNTAHDTQLSGTVSGVSISKLLSLFHQQFLEFGIRNILYGLFAIDGQCGGGAGALAEDHEHRLHPNRAEGDVRGGETNRHQ